MRVNVISILSRLSMLPMKSQTNCDASGVDCGVVTVVRPCCRQADANTSSRAKATRWGRIRNLMPSRTRCEQTMNVPLENTALLGDRDRLVRQELLIGGNNEIPDIHCVDL